MMEVRNMDKKERAYIMAEIARYDQGIVNLRFKRAAHIAHADALSMNISELEKEVAHNYRKLERARSEESEK